MHMITCIQCWFQSYSVWSDLLHTLACLMACNWLYCRCSAVTNTPLTQCFLLLYTCILFMIVELQHMLTSASGSWRLVQQLMIRQMRHLTFIVAIIVPGLVWYARSLLQLKLCVPASCQHNPVWEQLVWPAEAVVVLVVYNWYCRFTSLWLSIEHINFDQIKLSKVNSARIHFQSDLRIYVSGTDSFNGQAWSCRIIFCPIPNGEVPVHPLQQMGFLYGPCASGCPICTALTVRYGILLCHPAIPKSCHTFVIMAV